MQFSTRRTNFYTLLLFITFDAWTTTIHLSEIRYSAYFASHRDIFQTQPLQKGLLSLVLHIGHLSGVPVNPGEAGGGGTPKNSWWKCAATWFSKSWASFRPKNIIFHTRFQNWPLRPGPPYLRVWMTIPPSNLKVWICHCAGQVWNQVVVRSNVSPQNRHYFCCFFLGK